MKKKALIFAIAMIAGLISAIIASLRPSLIALLVTSSEWKVREEFKIFSPILSLMPDSTAVTLLFLEIIDVASLFIAGTCVVFASTLHVADMRLKISRSTLMKMKIGDPEISDHISAVKTYSDTIENFIKYSSVPTFVAVIQIGLSLYVLSIQSIYSFVLITAASIIFIFIVYFYSRSFDKLVRAKFDTENKLLKSNSIDSRRGRDIFYGGKKSIWLSKRIKEIISVAKAHSSIGFIETIYHTGTSSLINFWILLGYFYLKIIHNLSNEIFLSYILYVGLIMGPILRISSFIPELQQYLISKKFIKNYIKNFKNISDGKIIQFPIVVSSLKNFETKIVIHRSEKLAIIGSSGSGKTTTLEKIIGFKNIGLGTEYEQKKHMNVNSMCVRYLSDTAPFEEGSVLINLARPKNRIIDIIKKYHLFDELNTDEIYAFLNRKIYQNGEPFSLGERQRIQILGAILDSPDLLVLDEALSGIDEHTEQKIIRRLIQDKELTLVYVGHRLSLQELFDKKVYITN